MAGNYTIPVDVELRTKQQNVKNLRSAIENEFRDIDFNSSIGKQLNKLFNQFDTKISDMDSILGKGMLDMGDLNKLNGIFNRMNLIVGQMRSSAHKAPLVDLGIDAQSIPELVEARNLVKQITSEMAKQKAVSTKDRLTQTGQQDLLDDLNKIQKTRAHENKPLGVNAKIIQDELAEAEQLIKQHYEKRDQLDKQFQEKSAKAKQSQKILDDAEADYVKNAQKASLKQIMALETAAGKKGKKSTLESQFGGGNKLSQKSAQKFLDEFMVEAGMAFEGTQISGTLTQKLWEGMFTENEITQMQQAGGDMGEALYAGLEQKLLDPTSRERFRQIVHDFSKESTGSAEGYANTADNIKKNLPNLMNQAKADAIEVQAIEQSQIDNANAITTLEPQIASFKAVVDRLAAAASTLETVIQNKYQKELNEANRAAEQAKTNVVDQGFPTTANAQVGNEPIPQYQQQGIQAQEAEKFKTNLQQSIKQWMGVREVINYIKRGVRQAYQDIKGLDKAMTNIAVVTDFSVSDLWGKINEYMSIAQQYGVTTQGVYEVSQLYFQQGLGEADTMAATTETLKMARIAGMDYAEAADGMTVAIRGFNMEMQDAAHVTDVYSKVAAITASDTQELVTAMSKTASSAAAVGSSFENTTAMLAVMIEATRESPQNLGSALKSIISRYGEMTKGLSEDSEGEEIDYNRVDAALKTVGISLKDAQGQFRDFDTVIEELSAKWDTLDSVTQRYIATIFAGNRQQSRFLALVSNYDRYMEVSEAAADSEDAGLLQYSKTLDSLETKLNNIKTSFQQFYMSLIDGPTIGAALDFVNNLIKGFNKLSKFTTILNIAGIISGIKVLGNLFINTFSSGFSNISAAWKTTLQEMVVASKKAGAESKIAYNEGQDTVPDQAPNQRPNKPIISRNRALTAAGFSIGGAALSGWGSAVAQENQTHGAWLSGAGSGLSTIGLALSLGASGWIAGLAGAVVALVSAISSIPTAFEEAQQKVEKQQEVVNQKNIERAQAKEDYANLTNYIEQYKELEKARFDSVENQEKWAELNNQIVESYPQLLDYYDLEGNAVANLNNIQQEALKAKQELINKNKEYYKSEIELNDLKKSQTLGIIGKSSIGKMSNAYTYMGDSLFVATVAGYQQGQEWTQDQERFSSIISQGGFLGDFFKKQFETLGTQQITGQTLLDIINEQGYSLFDLTSSAQKNANINNLSNLSQDSTALDYFAFVLKDLGLFNVKDGKVEVSETLSNLFDISQFDRASKTFAKGYASQIISTELLGKEEKIVEELSSVEKLFALRLENLYNAAKQAGELEEGTAYTDWLAQDQSSQIQEALNEWNLWYGELTNSQKEQLESILVTPKDISSLEDIYTLFAETGKTQTTQEDYAAIIDEYYQNIVSLDFLDASPALLNYSDFINSTEKLQEYMVEGVSSKEEAYFNYLEDYASIYSEGDALPDFDALREDFNKKISDTRPLEEVTDSWLTSILPEYHRLISSLTEGLSNEELLDFQAFSESTDEELNNAYKIEGRSLEKSYYAYLRDYVSNLKNSDSLETILLAGSINEIDRYNTFIKEQESVIEKASVDSSIYRAAEKRIDWVTEQSKQLVLGEKGSFKNIIDNAEAMGELVSLLYSEDIGTFEWQNKLGEFSQKYGISFDNKDIQQLLYQNVDTMFSNYQSGFEKYQEEIENLYSSQADGWKETDSIAYAKKQRKKWSELFEDKNGRIVLKDFNTAIQDAQSVYTQPLKDFQSYGEKAIQFLNDATGSLGDFANKDQLDGLLKADEGLSALMESYTQLDSGEIIAAAKEYAGLGQDENLTWEQLSTYLSETYASIDTAFIDAMALRIQQNQEQALRIAERTSELQGSLEDQNKQEAYSMLSSKGLTGYTEDEIAQLEEYLGVGKGGLGAVETGEGTGEYRIDQTKLANLPTWVQNAILSIINDSVQSTKDGLEALAESVATKEKLSSTQKRDILGSEFSNLSDQSVESIWSDYESAMITGNFDHLEEILIAVFDGKEGIDTETAKRMAAESIARFQDNIDEDAQAIIDLKFAALEDAISNEDLNKLTQKGIDVSGLINKTQEGIHTLILEIVKNTDISFEDRASQAAKAYKYDFEREFGVETDVAQTLAETESWDRSTAQDFLGELSALTKIDYNIRDWFAERADGTFELIKSEAQLETELNNITDANVRQQVQDSYNFLKGWHKQAKKESAISELEGLATQSEFTASEIRDFYFEQLNQVIDVTTAEDIATRLEALGPMARLNEWIAMYQNAGITIDQDKYQQLVNLVLDSIIESISSGISSLGSGLEGTLGAADYQNLVKKYGLSGKARRTSKGLQLSNADQQKLISQMFIEAQNAGLESDFGEQIWEVYRDSQEDAIDGYTAIEEEITRVKGEHKELTGEALAYVEALQQARHAAMFDEDSVEFAFMEQDAADGLTKNFDKFVDNIDKVKDAFSAFKSGEAVGYQDFYNIMDYMNRFGADGGTNSFIQQIEKSGHTYESFVNSVVANTDKWGKVDIGRVAAEMGISVDAAMSGMAEGMEESLKEVAKQQIKYLSSLEAMLEALLILESIGEISFGLNMSIDINGDGTNDLNFATYGDLFDWYEKLPPEQQKTMLASIKLGFENRYGKETGGNIFSGLFGDGDIDFLDKALGSVLDNEKLFNKFKQDINDPNGVFKKIMSKVGEDGSLGEGLGLAVMDAFNIEGVKWEDMFSWGKDNSITGWGPKLLEAIGDSGLTPEQLTEKIFGTLLNIDPNTITASFASKLSGQTISLEGMEPFKLEMGADGGIYLPEGITISPDNMAAFQSQIESIIGKEITNLKIGEDGKITFDLASATEGVDDINTNFQTAAEAASTLQTAITQISTVASTFQAGSGFQSLADQLNAAADAAERLAGALGIKVETPQMPEMPFGTGEGQINGMDYLSSQDILGLGMGPLSPEGLNAQLNQMFATQFAGDAALQIPAKIVGEGGADVTDALKSNLLSKPAIPVPGKLDLSAGGKGAGKEADKVEIEAEVNTESADEQLNTLKTSMDTVNETPVQVDTTDNGTTQAVTELLNAAYEAAVLVEESDPNTAVTETGSTFVKEQLDAVAQAAKSIPTSINISVSVSGVAKALGSIALLKLAGGLWTGNINDIGGPALADGNTGESARKLIAGANIANKTLVGELGPELMVYNNQYQLVGQNGAEFVKVPKDAIVFNHLQTKGIFNGQMGVRGKAMINGNVAGPAAASGIAGALAAVRRAKSVWQGLLNSLSAADLMGAGGGGGGGGGDDNSLKAHIEDLQEWYNLSRQIAKIEQEINTLLAKRKNITDGHEYLKNLRETQKLLTQQVATQQVLVKYQQAQLEAQAQHINTHSIWSQFLTVGEDGLLQYKDGNETNGGKGSLSVLQQMNQMSGEEQVAFLAKLGYSYTDNDGNELEGEELVAKFFEELQKQIDDYDALADAVAEAEEAMADLEAEIAEIEREIRDNEIELGQNIYDIMVAAWEENIKNLKEQNELIKEANEAYVNGIQEAIDAERQMYEQNKAISDREQLQRQLALLRRSGGSASEIANLEQQLDDMLKDEYFANQEDALENIRDANERQAELLDQQVKIQEESLEYEKENGVIWSKVYEVMQGTDAEILDFMQGNDPTFFEKQALEQEDMLTEWAKKIGIYTEERQRQNYIKELDANSFNNALVSADGKTDYTSVYNKLKDSEKKTLKDLFERTYSDARIDGKSEAEALKLANEAIQKFLKDWQKAQTPASSNNNSGGGNSGGSSGSSNSNSGGRYVTVTYYQATGRVGGSQGEKTVSGPRNTNSAQDAKNGLKSRYPSAFGISVRSWTAQEWREYATGGIIDYTGPAWVDGSKSKPERILSAEQNKILEEGLAMNAGRSDRLQEMFSNFAENLGASVRASISNITNRTSDSAITIQPGAVQLNIEQLNDKYDVDELFNDVADRLYSIASKASGRGVSRR